MDKYETHEGENKIIYFSDGHMHMKFPGVRCDDYDEGIDLWYEKHIKKGLSRVVDKNGSEFEINYYDHISDFAIITFAVYDRKFDDGEIWEEKKFRCSGKLKITKDNSVHFKIYHVMEVPLDTPFYDK